MKNLKFLSILSTVIVLNNPINSMGVDTEPSVTIANKIKILTGPNGGFKINDRLYTNADEIFSSINKDGRKDIKFLYDANGRPHGVILLEQYYPSIFAIPIEFNGFTYSNGEQRFNIDTAINFFIKSLGQLVEEEPEYKLVQEELKHLSKLFESGQATVEDLRVKQENILKQLNEFKELSVLTPDSDPLTPLQAGIDVAASTVEQRMDKFKFGESAPAAGDVLKTGGVWVKGMVGTARQKEMSHNPAYKLGQQGGAIGFDFGEDYLIGVAYTRLNSKVKSSNIEEKLASNIGTVYGLYNFANDFFINGQLMYGRSTIKKHRYTRDSLSNIAYGETKAEMAGGQLELGYYYNFMDNSQFIPSIGLAHDNVKVKGYSETGNGFNRSVNKRNGKKTSALARLMVDRTLYIQSFILIPEIHTDIDYAIKRDNKGTLVTLFQGVDPVYIAAAKPSKAYYTIGGSLKTIRGQTFDVTLGYDLGLSKKFHSHSGYVQVRVNF